MGNSEQNRANKLEKEENKSSNLQTDEKAKDKNTDATEEKMIKRKDDAGYTPAENQFADGKGTQLDEEINNDSSS